MLKINTSFVVDISGTKFHFKKPTFKTLQSFDAKRKSGEDFIGEIFADLIKVENFEDEQGKQFSADDVKTLDLPFDCINQIIEAWSVEVKKLTGDVKDPNAGKQPSESSDS